MSAILSDSPGAHAEIVDIIMIRDFLGVAPDRLDACLADFRRWIAAARAFGDFGVVLTPRFLWVDDGQPFLYARVPQHPDELAALAQKLGGVPLPESEEA